MRQTFEELIGFHLDDFYSAALCFTQDTHQAEELLQEASIRAFHEFARLSRGSDFRGAMLEVLVSTYLQRQRRQGHDPLATEPASLEQVLASFPRQEIEPFPEPGTAGYRLLIQWLRRVWSELEDGDRLVLWLADIERMRHARVAELTAISEEQVRARHYRARLALRRGATRELSQAAARGEA